MRIRLFFGDNVTGITMEWHKPLMDFPKVVNYIYRNWEWFLYEPGGNSGVDQILRFSELKNYDPRYLIKAPGVDECILLGKEPQCWCGGDKHSTKDGPPTHMFMCPKWKKM